MKQDYIIFDGRRIAAYQIAEEFCKSKGWSDEFLAELWEGILSEPVLYDEFTYFLEMNELTGNTVCEGYTMFDLYFYHLHDYNAHHDVGKDTSVTDKDEIMYLAFHTMGQLKREPEKYRKMLNKCEGMDFM